MGATPADTEREITRLRGDMSAAIEEIERRIRGGLRGVARAEARLTSARTREDVVERARDNPTLLGVAGVVTAGGVAYGAYALINTMRERRKPQNRLRRGVQNVREELSERVERLGEGVEGSRRQLGSAWQRGLLLKLDPEDGGYVRVSDARLDPPKKKGRKRGQSTVIKKFVWAGLLAVFMALGSVIARRVADNVWRAMVREDPPTEKSKVKS
ncbi:MAG: hypothetical protein M3069_33550 [Chloroflexota bacterium]|nr:hypothetical protein [Chloroflexota bacterium]